jgi:hypothetical protein
MPAARLTTCGMMSCLTKYPLMPGRVGGSRAVLAAGPDDL